MCEEDARPHFSTRLAFFLRRERKSHGFCRASEKLVRRLSASNHISALNDAITFAAGNPLDS